MTNRMDLAPAGREWEINGHGGAGAPNRRAQKLVEYGCRCEYIAAIASVSETGLIKCDRVER
jgi:hypothetical protein